MPFYFYRKTVILPYSKEQIVNLKNYLQSDRCDLNIAKEKIIINWHQLSNLGSMYEDLCREWFLPKTISLATSYPEVPEMKIIKVNA